MYSRTNDRAAPLSVTAIQQSNPIQDLYRRGHEIATHSISHENQEGYWDKGSQDTWAAEMGGSRDIAATWANIPAQVSMYHLR